VHATTLGRTEIVNTMMIGIKTGENLMFCSMEGLKAVKTFKGKELARLGFFEFIFCV
jgi:hypothetical protein